MIKKWYKRWIKREKWHGQLHHVENKKKMIVEAIDEATLELRNKYNLSMQVIEDTEYPFPSASFGLFNSPIREAIFTGKVRYYHDNPFNNDFFVISCKIDYKNKEYSTYQLVCPRDSLRKEVIKSVIECCFKKLMRCKEIDIDLKVSGMFIEMTKHWIAPCTFTEWQKQWEDGKKVNK